MLCLDVGLRLPQRDDQAVALSAGKSIASRMGVVLRFVDLLHVGDLVRFLFLVA
jgi:hypothetical protein